MIKKNTWAKHIYEYALCTIRSHGTKSHAGEQVTQWDFQNNATRPPGPAFGRDVKNIEAK